MVVFLVPHVSNCVLWFVVTGFKCCWSASRMSNWNMERDKTGNYPDSSVLMWSDGGTNVLYFWARDSSLTWWIDKCLDDCPISSRSRRRIAHGVWRCVPSKLQNIQTFHSHGLESVTAALRWLEIVVFSVTFRVLAPWWRCRSSDKATVWTFSVCSKASRQSLGPSSVLFSAFPWLFHSY
jgi:hypothetical protein